MSASSSSRHHHHSRRVRRLTGLLVALPLAVAYAQSGPLEPLTARAVTSRGAGYLNSALESLERSGSAQKLTEAVGR